MPHPRYREFLFTGVLEFDGTPGLQCQDRGDRLSHHLLLVTEPPTDARFDDVDVANGDVESKGQHAAAVIRDLGAGTQDQPLIFIEERNRHMGLKAGVLLVLDLELMLNYEVGFAEARFQIADLDIDMRRDVPPGIVNPVAFRLVVNYRGARIHRLPVIEDRRKNLI